MTVKLSAMLGKRCGREASALCLVIAFGLIPATARAQGWQLPPAPSRAGTEAAPSAAAGLRPAPREAEPSDDDPHYARICDVLGEGFIYSPRTSTCIKIGGYVRFGLGSGGWK